MSYVPGATYSTVFFSEMIYLALVLFFGWMTIAFKTWYESGRNKAKEVEPGEAKIII